MRPAACCTLLLLLIPLLLLLHAALNSLGGRPWYSHTLRMPGELCVPTKSFLKKPPNFLKMFLKFPKSRFQFLIRVCFVGAGS